VYLILIQKNRKKTEVLMHENSILRRFLERLLHKKDQTLIKEAFNPIPNPEKPTL